MKLHENLVISLLVAAGIFGSMVSDAIAQTPEDTVPVASEANHKIRFDNGLVRAYEVLLQKGKSTLMHEHRADSFVVFLSNSEIQVETKGGKSATPKIHAGTVAFASTATGPYSHRLTDIGESPFHVIAAQLQSASPSGPATANLRPPSTFKVLMENARGRAYHILLSPGASTESFNRPAGSMLFAISGGRISETISGKSTIDGLPERLWDFEPGFLRWSDTAAKLSMKNESAAPIERVEIEVF